MLKYLRQHELKVTSWTAENCRSSKSYSLLNTVRNNRNSKSNESYHQHKSRHYSQPLRKYKNLIQSSDYSLTANCRVAAGACACVSKRRQEQSMSSCDQVFFETTQVTEVTENNIGTARN